VKVVEALSNFRSDKAIEDFAFLKAKNQIVNDKLMLDIDK